MTISAIIECPHASDESNQSEYLFSIITGDQNMAYPQLITVHQMEVKMTEYPFIIFKLIHTQWLAISGVDVCEAR